MKYYITKTEVQTSGFEKIVISLQYASSAEEAMRQACEDELHTPISEDGSYWEDESLIDGNYQFVYTPYEAEEVLPEHVEILKRYI